MGTCSRFPDHVRRTAIGAEQKPVIELKCFRFCPFPAVDTSTPSGIARRVSATGVTPTKENRGGCNVKVRRLRLSALLV